MPDTTEIDLRQQFLIDPDITFLNHGSFGACPEPVFRKYQEWQRTFESSPVEFFARKYPELMRDARRSLASFVHSDPNDVVFLTNATVAINVVAHSLDVGPGDEVLMSNHEYGACERLWEFLRRRQGFEIRVVDIPVPDSTSESVVDRFREAITDRTQVLFFSHITSPTALLLPAEQLCGMCRERQITSVVDGAHAIGQIPLCLNSLGADFYTSNLHKWLCAPKGSAFLYARKELQSILNPLVVSWGWEPAFEVDTPFVGHHEWRGTRDYAAHLVTSDAIRFQKENEWGSVRSRCAELARWGAAEMESRYGFRRISNDADQDLQMQAMMVPEKVSGAELQRMLFEEYRIEIPVVAWNDIETIRISVQGYNSKQDVERLLDAVGTILPDCAPV